MFFLAFSFALESTNVNFDIEYEIKPAGNVSITLTTLIPNTITNRQTIQSIFYSVKPVRVFNNDNNRYVVFSLQNFECKTNIVISVKALLYRADLDTAIKHSYPVTLVESSYRQRYLQAEKYIEADDPLIIKTARKLKGKTDLETVSNIYSFVTKTVAYAGFIPEEMSALEVLSKKKTDCDGFASLFIALCRACELPSKFIDGFTLYKTDYPTHAWAECHVNNSWIRFDVTRRDLPILLNYYLQVSDKRTDIALNNWHYYFYKTRSNKVTVELSVRF